MFFEKNSCLHFLTIREIFYGENFSAEFWEMHIWQSKKSMIQNNLCVKNISNIFDPWAKCYRILVKHFGKHAIAELYVFSETLREKTFNWKSPTFSSSSGIDWKVFGFRENFFGQSSKIHSFCLKERFEEKGHFFRRCLLIMSAQWAEMFQPFGGIISTRLTKLPAP